MAALWSKRLGLMVFGAVLVSIGLSAFATAPTLSRTAVPYYYTTPAEGSIQDTATVVGDWVNTFNEKLIVGAHVFNAAGGSTMTNFAVEIAPYPDTAANMDTYAQVILTGTDFTTLAGSNTLPYCSSTVPNTLAAGSTAYFEFRPPACHAFRFKATAAAAPADASTVTVRGTAAQDR